MSEVVIPSTPADIKKIRDAIEEGVDCLNRIASEKEALKDIIESVEEKYDIPKKHVNKMIQRKFKDDFDKMQAEVDEFEALWLKIMRR
jgi:septation ring formation regulator EzrA